MVQSVFVSNAVYYFVCDLAKFAEGVVRMELIPPDFDHPCLVSGFSRPIAKMIMEFANINHSTGVTVTHMDAFLNQIHGNFPMAVRTLTASLVEYLGTCRSGGLCFFFAFCSFFYEVFNLVATLYSAWPTHTTWISHLVLVAADLLTLVYPSWKSREGARKFHKHALRVLRRLYPVFPINY